MPASIRFRPHAGICRREPPGSRTAADGRKQWLIPSFFDRKFFAIPVVGQRPALLRRVLPKTTTPRRMAGRSHSIDR